MTDTIPALFARQATAHATRTLFLVKQQRAYRPVTWGQAAEDVTALAAFLLERQVNPGDRILLLSENRPEWGLADLAIQSVGAWTVPVYASLTAEDLRLICADCQPVLGVASTADQLQKLIQVMAEIPALQMVIAMDGPATHESRVMLWPEALERGRSLQPKLQGLLDHRMRDLRPMDTATLLYTSGTTGEPKGVMLSHANFLSNVGACLQAVPIYGHDVHLSFLPLSHVFERMAGWYLMLSIGATIAYAENMETIPQNMVEVRPTIMLGVPRFFEKLYARIQEALRQSPPSKRRLIDWALGVGRAVMARQLAGQQLPPLLVLQRAVADALVCKKFRDKLGGRLRFFVSGSAPLSKEIGEFFYSVGVTILEGYGLTETSPVIAVNRLPTPQFGSVGPLVPGVEVRIADDGEILTRGPHVMQGYYRKPQMTAEVIVDGWFHTGDIGHLDDQGFLYITDRKKDLIKTAGGKFVAPQKLENLFTSDPYISQAFVYGDKQRYCVALIVPNMEQLRRYAQEQEIGAESAKELVQHPRIQDFYWGRVAAKQAALASFEQVKKIALLDQEFSQAAGELTPTLKAKRGLIAQRYGPLLQTLYVVIALLILGAVRLSAEEAQGLDSQDWPVLIAQLRQEVQRRPGLAHPREQLAIAYNNYGVSLSNAGQWDVAVSQLQEAIRLEPTNGQFHHNLANIYLNHAQALAESHRETDAVTFITQALEHHPTLVAGYLLLGDIEYGRQRLKEAKAAWERALALEPANADLAERLGRLKQEFAIESGFDRLSQAYFDLRYEDALEQPIGFDIRDTLLQARREVGTDFAYWPSYKIVVLIYSSEHFRALRQETPEWIGGLYDGKIRVPLPGKEFDAERVRGILFHEYTHALVHDLTKNRCPQWFNEGVATYEEMKRATPPLDQLARTAAARQLVSWDRLNDQFAWGLPADQVALGYQQSYSIIRYLVERYGFWRIRRVLKAFQDGATLEEALGQEYRLKLSRLETDWRTWLLEELHLTH